MTAHPGPVHGPTWHTVRRKQLLRDHPEARRLVGRDPWTGAWVLVLVALQLGLATALQRGPWWLALPAAYLVGAVVAHALGVLIHDLAHDLVFRSANANRLLAILANVPLLFPAAIDFREKHLAHHAHLGEPDGRDTQAPQPWEFPFVSSRLRAFVWHGFGPLLAHRTQHQRPSRWLTLNTALLAATLLPFLALTGGTALLYLAASGWLAFGPHPVGIRRYGEHLVLAPGQPTASYYGPLNRVAFDVGYHVEHHDLPGVPWSQLRRLHQLAPELYRPLRHVPSWSELLWGLLTRPHEGPWRYFLQGSRRPRPAPGEATGIVSRGQEG